MSALAGDLGQIGSLLTKNTAIFALFVNREASASRMRAFGGRLSAHRYSPGFIDIA
jgi:hypothetical protein